MHILFPFLFVTGTLHLIFLSFLMITELYLFKRHWIIDISRFVHIFNGAPNFSYFFHLLLQDIYLFGGSNDAAKVTTPFDDIYKLSLSELTACFFIILFWSRQLDYKHWNMGHTLKKVISEFANSNFGVKTSKINRKNHFKISAQPPTIVKQRRSAKGIILLSLLFCFSEKCLHNGV